MGNITDIAIHESGNGGDLSLTNNDLTTISGLTNQIYLALFGGNINNDIGEQYEDYWANEFINEENKYISTFEKTLLEVAITSNGLQKLKQAAENDLNYLKKYADITISISIVSKELLSLHVDLKAPNNMSGKVRILWNAQTKEIIEKWLL